MPTDDSTLSPLSSCDYMDGGAVGSTGKVMSPLMGVIENALNGDITLPVLLGVKSTKVLLKVY